MVGYAPNEGDSEGRDKFWNNMDTVLDRVGNGYRLCILGDLNGWITGTFGVPGENDKGRRVEGVGNK